MAVQFIAGDCRQALAGLADGSVHCVVTSPPYFGLRDYQVAGQIGLEPTLAEYLAEMVGVFREVRAIVEEEAAWWVRNGR